jgi:transposase
MRPHGSPQSLAKRRQRAIALLQQGLSPVDVARKVGVDRRSVRRWRATFEQRGEKGLAPKPAPGRPPKLSDKQRDQLVRLLLKGATAAGYATDLWTCPRIAGLIQHRFGVVYHANHIGRLLRGLGWSPQKPARRARERDEQAIQRWVQTDWPRVKKTPGA